MAIIYYPSGSTQYVRTATYGGMIEQFINVAPNQIIYLSGSTIGVPTDVATASYAQTASVSISSLASYVSPSVYGSVSSSFNPITDISQGSCALWFTPDSGTFADAFGSIVRTQVDREVIHTWKDIYPYSYIGATAQVSPSQAHTFKPAWNWYDGMERFTRFYPQNLCRGGGFASLFPIIPAHVLLLLPFLPFSPLPSSASGLRRGVWLQNSP